MLRTFETSSYRLIHRLGVYPKQPLDGTITKASLGGEKTGRNPIDRGKLGVKRSVLTDGNGVPLIDGANRHDSKLVHETLASVPLDIRTFENTTLKGFALTAVISVPKLRKRWNRFMIHSLYGVETTKPIPSKLKRRKRLDVGSSGVLTAG